MSRNRPEPGDIFEAQLGWFNPDSNEWEYKVRPTLVLIVKTARLIRICSITSIKPTSTARAPLGSIVISPDRKNGLWKESYILSYNVFTVSKTDLGRYLGEIEEKFLDQVLDEASNFD